MDDIKIKLYNNPEYYEYGSQDCYLLYISNIGLYLSTEDDTFKVEEKKIPGIEIMDYDTIDKYASSRGFIKAVEFVDKKHINWFNGYDNKKLEVKKKLLNINNRLIIKLRYELCKVDGQLKSIYVIINNLCKLIK